jgi:Ca2+-binding RTX toxin-like protein
MPIHWGTTGDDYIETTPGEDDIVFAGAQTDRIKLSSGNDLIDGEEGFDQLLYMSNDSALNTYILNDTSFTSSTGSVSTTFSSIEAFAFSVTSPFLTTFDASDWVPAGGTVAGYTIVQAYGGNSRITGSAYSDDIYVDGANNIVDAGAGGYDRVYAAPAGIAEPYRIFTSDGVTRIRQGAADDPDRTVIAITNAELVGVAASYDTTINQTVIATHSAVSVHFIDGFSSDTFVGSAHDDLFDSTTSFHIDEGIDTFTGGGGADTFSFIGGAHRLDNTYITDLSTDDVVDLNGNKTEGNLISTFVGTAAFSGTAGEYRYEIGADQTIVQFDGDGDGVADGTLYISGEHRLLQASATAGPHALQIDPTIRGTSGDDTIGGTIGDDEVYAFGGNDAISGYAGNDLLYGGTGNDTIYGGLGEDRLYGGSGDDTIYGQGQDDELFGGAGHDILNGDAGTDLLYGGIGSDTIDGGVGEDRLYGGAGNDTVDGGGGDDNVFGGKDDDWVYGGAGDDLVQGHSGNDVIVGGAGVDVLVGGQGSDHFVFSDGDIGNDISATDHITDMFSGDKIDLSAIDADSTTAGDQAFTWIHVDAFSGTAGELRQEWVTLDGMPTTVVTGDTDGDGAADFVLLVARHGVVSDGSLIL